ncbi:efflux RND transporter periplasmic adaptor subunit [soil metagenome]
MDHDSRIISSPDGSATATSLKERVRLLRLPQKSPPAPSNKGLVSFLAFLCLGLAGVAIFLGYQYYLVSDRLADMDKGGAKLPSLAGSKIGETQAGSESSSAGSTQASSGEVVLERKGNMIPAHQIMISPKVAGMIESLNIEEGKRVQKGEILARIENVDYKADYEYALANADGCWHKWLELYSGSRPEEIRGAKARLDEMEAQKEQLYLDYKRNTRLTGTNAVAARDYEQAASAYRAMERRAMQMRQEYELMLEGPRAEKVDFAWAEVQQANANVVKSKWRLDNCAIRAPIAGTILIKRAELGNLVNPIAMNGSFSLCDMADLSDLEVELDIDERDIAKIHKGQSCKVRPEAFPGRTYEGVVARLMPQANRSKSAVPVRIKVQIPREEEGVYLKPEMGVVVAFYKQADAKTPDLKK